MCLRGRDYEPDWIKKNVAKAIESCVPIFIAIDFGVLKILWSVDQ